MISGIILISMVVAWLLIIVVVNREFCNNKDKIVSAIIGSFMLSQFYSILILFSAVQIEKIFDVDTSVDGSWGFYFGTLFLTSVYICIVIFIRSLKK